jgi:tetratricopeptide (TPR) repeat protein
MAKRPGRPGGRAGCYNAQVGWVALVLVACGYIGWFRVLPQRTVNRRLLEAVSRTPWLWPSAPRRARFRLLSLAWTDRQWQEVVQRSRALLEEWIAPDEQAIVLESLAVALGALGDSASEQRELERALALSLEPLQRAHLLLRAGDVDQAAQIYESRLAVPAERARALLGLSRASGERRDSRACLRYAEEALEAGLAGPAHYLALMQAALASSHLADRERLIRYLERALEVSPHVASDARHLSWLAQLRCSAGDFDDAMDLGRQAVALFPHASYRLHDLQADIHAAAGRWQAALDEWQLALAAPPEQAQAHAVRQVRRVGIHIRAAQLEIRLGRPHAARQRLALARVDAVDDALRLLCEAVEAVAMAADGRPAEARAALAALEASTEGSEPSMALGLLELRGWALGYLGERALERACWRRCLELNPSAVDRAEVEYRLARCAALEGDRAGAEEALARAVASGIETHYVGLARERLAALATPGGLEPAGWPT